MAERFFPGITFHQYKASEIVIETVPISDTERVRSIPTETINLNELITEYLGEMDEIEEAIAESWNQEEIMVEFVKTLESIQLPGQPAFSMEKRNMYFVTQEEMRPKTETERQELVAKYGEYIVDHSAGDCNIHPDGSFTMRIGYAGQEDTTDKADVLSTMAHEYGHTLGNHLELPVFEELKAYTFANLFMSRFYASEYHVLVLDTSTVHQEALAYLDQLLSLGINEAAILAHLSGDSFGGYDPDDYSRLRK